MMAMVFLCHNCIPESIALLDIDVTIAIVVMDSIILFILKM